MHPEQRTVLVLSLVVCFVMMGISIITPVLPSYGEDLGATPVFIGVLVGALALSRLLLDLPAGAFGDRHGQKRMMMLGLGLIGVSSVAAVIAWNYLFLLGVRIVEGIGSAFYVTSSLASLAKAAPVQRRGRYMSYYVSMLLLGQILGPVVGGFAAVNFGLRAPFLFYGLFATVGLVLVGVLLQVPESAPPRVAGVDWAAVRRLLRHRSFMLVNVGTMGAFFVRGGLIATVLPLFVVRNLGQREDITGLLISVSALSSLLTMLPSGVLADRRGRKLPFVLSLVLMGVTAPVLFYAPNLTALFVIMALYGLALGLHGPLASWAADLVDKEVMGTAMGLYRTVGDLGFVLGPVVLAAVLDATSVNGQVSVWPFVVAGVWLVASGVLLLLAEDPVGRRAKAGGAGTSPSAVRGGSAPPI